VYASFFTGLKILLLFISCHCGFLLFILLCNADMALWSVGLIFAVPYILLHAGSPQGTCFPFQTRILFCKIIYDLTSGSPSFLQLNEVTRKKTAEVDGQLTAELQAKLLQKQEVKKTVVEKVTVSKTEKQFQDCEKDSSEALTKLCEMQVN
jgi:hypothetical protein